MLALIRFGFRWTLRLIAFAVVITVALALFKDILLREWILFRVQALTGLETRLHRVSLRWPEATLTLHDLRIRNSPDFGGSLLLALPELHLELDRTALARREIRLRHARLHVAEASAVRSADGRTNVFVLRDAVTQNVSLLDLALVSPPGLVFTGIDTLDLTLGTLHLVDRIPPGFHRAIPIALTNEVVRNVQSFSDLNPLVVQVFVRELTTGIRQAIRTNTPAPNPGP